MHCRLAPNVSVLISLLFSSIQVGSRLNARQNVFPRSRLLLFLPFTRVRLNNTKRGIQIPHKNSNHNLTVYGGSRASSISTEVWFACIFNRSSHIESA